MQAVEREICQKLQAVEKAISGLAPDPVLVPPDMTQISPKSPTN
jgi:hypothetical protein